MRYFKNKLRERLSKFVKDHSAQPGLSLWGDSYWYRSPNLWEPTVMLALRDICKPGMIAFDVGGNMGGLTSAMSRLVGPNGRVCTFEASPRIISILQANVVAQGHNNVTVYNRAVYKQSNLHLKMYEGDHLNDSLYNDNGSNESGSVVKTIALDDYCDISQIYPDVVKMDIEGAEFDALLGFESTIVKCKPHFILEQQSNDYRCFNFLTAFDYVAIDLSNYDIVKSAEAFTEGDALRNILFVDRAKLSDLPYSLPVKFDGLRSIGVDLFSKNNHNGFTSQEFRLKPGRYVIDAKFTAAGTNNSLMCGVRKGGVDFFRYHGYSRLLAENYRGWIVDIYDESNLCVFFEFQEGTADNTLEVFGVDIKKIKDFVPLKWPLLVMD